MMKKHIVLLSASAALLLTSCQVVTQTARTEGIGSSIASVTVADLDVYPERISASINKVPKALNRGGEENVKHAVEAKALETYGKGDLLVEPQYIVTKRRNFFGTRISDISVSGRPASFKNFRSLDDSVWTNPVFRGVKVIYTGAAQKPAASHVAGSSRKDYSAPRQKHDWRQRGFRFLAELSVTATMGDEKDPITNYDYLCYDNEAYYADISYNLSVGYQFGKHWFLGAGVEIAQPTGNYHVTTNNSGGTSYYSEVPYEAKVRDYPIFLQTRYYATRTQASPFIDLKIGGAVSGYTTLTHDDEKVGSTKTHDGAFFLSPSVGVSIATKKNWSVDLSCTYKLKRATFEDSRHDRGSGLYHFLGGSVCFNL